MPTEGWKGGKGGEGELLDPNAVVAPREKSLGTFKSMSKGGLSNPLFEQDRLDELVIETFRPVRLLRHLNNARFLIVLLGYPN